MVKKGLTCLVAVFFATPVWAATWTHVGTSEFKMGNETMKDSWETVAEDALTDFTRIKFASMVVDSAGNAYAVCNDFENFYYDDAVTYGRDGGVTIFKADGTTLNVNVRTAGYPGAITKLVLADGKVYALQNYREVNWIGDGNGRAGREHRILRINLNGTVDKIWNALTDGGNNNIDQDLISGMSVGPGGHVYWVMNSASWATYWRTRFMWRYNIVTQEVEESPRNGLFQDGWGETHAINHFEYVGGDWFAIMYSGRYVQAISWTQGRRTVEFEEGTSWASDRTIKLVYDPMNRKLWHGPRGGGSSTGYTAIMSRWNGDMANPGLFSEIDDTPKSGIVKDPDFPGASLWHMNGNNPALTGISNGGGYWCNALAINPADGTAWMSWGGDKWRDVINYTGHGDYGQLGGVYTVLKDGYDPTGIEGTPRVTSPRPSWVMELAFGNRGGSCYVFALTCDLNSGQYDLYSSPVDCPVTGSCCQRGNVCTIETLASCQALGGQYRGDNTDCSEPCDVVHACCQKKNVCTEEIEYDCNNLGGEFQDGVACSEADCRWKICQDIIADTDGDGDVDQLDFAIWQACMTMTGTISDDPVKCSCYDVAGGPEGPDGLINAADFGPFVNCGSGANVPLDPNCQN